MKWEDINIDFVVGLPRTHKQYNSIWVVVYRFTKCAHFIFINSTYSVEDYARIFIDNIVSRHGIPLSIILDQREQFTSRYWRSVHKGLGTKVKLISAFHPQMERNIQTLEDMLRTCIFDFQENWDKQLRWSLFIIIVFFIHIHRFL